MIRIELMVGTLGTDLIRPDKLLVFSLHVS